MKRRRYTIAVDFDGVLAEYAGWKGSGNLGPARPGAREFLEQLTKDYQVVIHTNRGTSEVWDWLRENDMEQYVLAVGDRKPLAIAYIDDRAIEFRGDFSETLQKLQEFREGKMPYWKRGSEND